MGRSATGEKIVVFHSYCVTETHSAGRFRVDHRVSVSTHGGSFAIPVETVIMMIMVTVMTPHCSHRSDHGHVVPALYLGFVLNPVAIDYTPVDSGPLLLVAIANLCRNLLEIISCTQKQHSGEGSNPLSTG